jgi:AraC-like DNA-binding protein
MNYREIQPPPELALYIKCFWALEYDGVPGAADAEPVLPDGCPEIVFNLSDRFVRIGGAGEELQPRTLIAGQMTRNISIRPSGRVRLFGVRFLPAGASPFLRLPLDEITDRIVELGAILGAAGNEIEERINLAGSFEERVAILAGYFNRELVRHGPADPLTSLTALRIVEQSGRLPVSAIATRLGVSERRLERRFKREIGISPKLFSRIVRFQTVVRVLQDGSSPDLLDTALAGGFYDQSHLNRDFNEFAGESPLAFFDRTHLISDAFTGVV